MSKNCVNIVIFFKSRVKSGEGRGGEEGGQGRSPRAPGGKGTAQYWGATEVSNRTGQQVTSPAPQQHRR